MKQNPGGSRTRAEFHKGGWDDFGVACFSGGFNDP